MTPNLNRKHLVVLLAVVALTVQGCATVAPGEDPILVRAQQTYATSRATFDLLFNLELDNTVLIESKLPGTHKVVDTIKTNAKKAIPSLLSAIDTYKANKNKDQLSLWLAVVDDLLRSAQEQIGKLASVGAVNGGG